MSLASGPSARQGCSLAPWEGRAGNALLFGGRAGPGAAMADAWILQLRMTPHSSHHGDESALTHSPTHVWTEAQVRPLVPAGCTPAPRWGYILCPVPMTRAVVQAAGLSTAPG